MQRATIPHQVDKSAIVKHDTELLKGKLSHDKPVHIWLLTLIINIQKYV